MYTLRVSEELYFSEERKRESKLLHLLVVIFDPQFVSKLLELDIMRVFVENSNSNIW